MTETIGLIVVAAAMVAIIVVMLRGLSPAHAGGAPFSGFAGTGSLGGFAGGMVAAVAAGTTLNTAGAPVAGAASVGAMLGLAYVLLTRLSIPFGIQLVSNVVGTAGFVALVVFLITGTGCAVVPLWQRLLILGLVVVSGVVGVVGSALLFRPRIPSVLALFGATKIAVFLSAPLGVSLLDLPVEAWLIAFVAASLLGALSALAPQFVIGLAAAVIGVASLSVSVVVGDTCSSGPDFSDLSAIVGFAAVYLLVSLLLGRWLRR